MPSFKKESHRMKTFRETILYFFGLGENPVRFKRHSDSEAMRSDWERVGNDIYRSMRRYEETR